MHKIQKTNIDGITSGQTASMEKADGICRGKLPPKDSEGKEVISMYDNEIYSGSGAGENTSGVFSKAEGNMNRTQNDFQNQSQNNAQGYATYQMGDIGSREEAPGQDGREENGREKKPGHGGNGGFFRKALISVSMGLFFGLFAGIGFYAVQQGLNVVKPANGDSAVVESATQPGQEESNSGIKLTNTNNITVVESDISNVVKEVMPAMVSIINNYTETGNFFGQTFTQEQAASGSGIIVAENDTELLIVSNYHVVSDATKLVVTFINGSEAEAKIKGTDADMDLAVIAVPLDSLDEDTKNAISIATLGNSDELTLGEPVIAIGNALGYGQSVTNGIISALDRELTLDDGSKGTFIQTNAAINPGNSGGALLNINGEVIGINSNKIGATAVEGMGYAIPISSASPIIADLMERRTRDKVTEGESGYIGITLRETAQIAEMYDMPVGIWVTSVEAGAAADEAGLLKGDIITAFDGQKVNSYAALQEVLQYYAAGDSAKITVMRSENGEYVKYELEITLGSKPSGIQ